MTLTQKWLASLSLIFALPAFANNPPSLKIAGQGKALYMRVIKVYDAELSVSDNAVRNNVLSAGVSRCLRLDYAVDLTADKFVLAAERVLQRQHDASTLAQIQPQLEQFHAAYQDVKKGDVYRMCYTAATQTTSLSLNGETLVQVNSDTFAKHYFGIWLGEKRPIAQRLRKDLLKRL